MAAVPPTAAGPAAPGAEVRRVLWIEGLCNVAVLTAKCVVGFATGSTTILSDAIHSLGDVANNAIALVAERLASAPPDREHPYGHRRYETLAVFLLATLLVVLAVEVALRSFNAGREVVHHDWSLALMLGVLMVNICLALWEGRRAKQLGSDLLRADARHTLSDVFTTIVVIIGWQLAARGQIWLEVVLTLGVSVLILSLAYDLFRRAIPVLVDHVATDPEQLIAAVDSVDGVRETRLARSRAGAHGPQIDVVVAVEGTLTTEESHEIADAVERALRRRFAAEDVTVHVEPAEHRPAR